MAMMGWQLSFSWSNGSGPALGSGIFVCCRILGRRRCGAGKGDSCIPGVESIVRDRTGPSDSKDRHIGERMRLLMVIRNLVKISCSICHTVG